MRLYCDGDKIYPEILADLHVRSTPEYENVIYMRKYCGGENEKIDVKILSGLHVFRTPEYEKGGFGMLSICMDVPLSCTRMVGWILYIFGI
jgi:hypothetical protein